MAPRSKKLILSDELLKEFLIQELSAKPGLTASELYDRQAGALKAGYQRITEQIPKLREQGLVPPEDPRVTFENCVNLCGASPATALQYKRGQWEVTEDQTIIRIMQEKLDAGDNVVYASEMATLMAALPQRSAQTIFRRFRDILNDLMRLEASSKPKQQESSPAVSSPVTSASSPLSNLSPSASESGQSDASAPGSKAKTGKPVTNPTAEDSDAAETLLSLCYGVGGPQTNTNNTDTTPTAEELDAAEALLSLRYGAEKAKLIVRAAHAPAVDPDTEMTDAS